MKLRDMLKKQPMVDYVFFCEEIESGREPIYKYVDKLSGGFSAVIMNLFVLKVISNLV